MNQYNITLKEYQTEAAKTDLNGSLAIETIILGLVSEVGELAELYYKARRDRKDIQTIDVVHELGDAFWYISSFCTNMGLSLDKVAQINLKKLADRQARNKIQGSGDNR